MKRYPAYKDSGVEWIGEIPVHWEIGRIKYFNEIIMGQSPSSEDYTENLNSLPFLQGNAEFGDHNPTPSIYCDTANKKTLKDDILISVRAPVGAINVSDREYGIGRGLAAVRSVERYRFNYYYLFKSKNYLDSLSTGSTFTAITVEDLKNLPYPKIPIPEQSQIATFLDHKIRQIDDLIAKKQKLIELLKEERTAIINHAVTKGLDPNVTRKDSGIEWLGEIPEHWEIVRLKFLIKDLKSGVSVNSEEIPVNENEVGILKTSCVYNYYFDPTENKKVLPEEISRVTCQVKGNRIIISRMNTPELVGASGYVEQEFPNLYLPDRLWLTELNTQMDFDVKWLSFIFISHSFRELLSSKATGTSPSMKNISKDDLLTIKVPLPHRDEQKKIKSAIEFFTKTQQDIVNRIDKEIVLLKEYKTALINESITGKIDVRDYQINHA